MVYFYRILYNDEKWFMTNLINMMSSNWTVYNNIGLPQERKSSNNLTWHLKKAEKEQSPSPKEIIKIRVEIN